MALKYELIEIENKSQAIVNMGDQLFKITNKTEIFDLFLIALLNRTVNLNRGFVNLMRDNNYIAAAPIIRINLDSLLRIYASGISEYDRNNFALKVISGEQIRKMKIRGTKTPMQDIHLVNSITKVDGMAWVKDIYDSGNSFVHFSDNVIFSSQRIVNEEKRTIEFTIGMNDSFIEDEIKLNTTIWLNKIIDSIVLQAQIYIYEKCQKYGVDIESLNYSNK
ncbi:hypothetical protein LB456_03030 [Psychroflexus sp. CAK57W]|uniref:hypothetical protein n=1 Tax=Psychroflexus curvus TaxID=2873595 RepID=UPI001CCBBAD1|nr:hypothetical protein [Psychroflexus curvus]MBZ9786420.1 hypothetical protein [Psychroflexus curvus]